MSNIQKLEQLLKDEKATGNQLITTFNRCWKSHPKETIDCLKKALKAGNIRAYFIWGKILANKGKYEPATEWFRKILKDTKPKCQLHKDAETALRVSNQKMMVNQSRTAKKKAENPTVVEHKPTTPITSISSQPTDIQRFDLLLKNEEVTGAKLVSALNQSLRSNHKETMGCLRKAYKDGRSQASYLYGKMFASKGRYDLATKCFHKTIKDTKPNSPLHKEIKEALKISEQKRYEEKYRSIQDKDKLLARYWTYKILCTCPDYQPAKKRLVELEPKSTVVFTNTLTFLLQEAYKAALALKNRPKSNKLAEFFNGLGKAIGIIDLVLKPADIALPLVKLPFKAVGWISGVAGSCLDYLDEKEQKEATRISQRLDSDVIQSLAIHLGHNYHYQIEQLSVEEAKDLAHHALVRLLYFMKTTDIPSCESSEDYLARGLIEGDPPIKSIFNHTVCKSKNWTAEGIFKRTGIQLPDGTKWVRRDHNWMLKDPLASRVDKYEYRLGTVAEKARYGLEQKVAVSSNERSAFDQEQRVLGDIFLMASKDPKHPDVHEMHMCLLQGLHVRSSRSSTDSPSVKRASASTFFRPSTALTSTELSVEQQKIELVKELSVLELQRTILETHLEKMEKDARDGEAKVSKEGKSKEKKTYEKVCIRIREIETRLKQLVGHSMLSPNETSTSDQSTRQTPSKGKSPSKTTINIG